MTRVSRGGSILLGLMVVLALVAAACSTDDSGDVSADESADAADQTDEADEADEADEPDAAADPPDEGESDEGISDEAGADEGEGDYLLPPPSTRGLTDDEIRVGVMVLDLTVDEEVGADLQIDESTKSYDVFFTDLNDRGGVDGRMVVPSYYKFSPIDLASQQAACLQATQDDEVFVVIVVVGFDGEAMLCVTEGNETLVVSGDSVPSSYFERSEGRLLSAAANDDRVMRAWAQVPHDEGVLDGKKVGVVYEDTITVSDAVEGALIPALEGLGYAPVAVALPCEGLHSPCAQHDTGVEVLRTEGVEVVFSALTSTAHPAFVSASQAVGFDPQWIVTGLNVSATITGILTADESRAEFYDGALAVGGTRLETSADARNSPGPSDFLFECADRYEVLTGEELVYDYNSKDNDAFGLAVGACGFVELIEQAAGSVPAAELNYATFSRTIQDTPVLLTTSGLGDPPSGWRPGKLDAGNITSFQRFEAACGCWVSVDGEVHQIPID